MDPIHHISYVLRAMVRAVELSRGKLGPSEPLGCFSRPLSLCHHGELASCYPRQHHLGKRRAHQGGEAFMDGFGNGTEYAPSVLLGRVRRQVACQFPETEAQASACFLRWGEGHGKSVDVMMTFL